MRSDRSRIRAARNYLIRFLVYLFHGAPFRKLRKTLDDFDSPRRILLLNGFHIGDIVIATCVIPILRAAYPSAEIGFATGSWSRMVVVGHPDLHYTHCIDHWMLNRGKIGLFRRIVQYRRTRRRALIEIRQLGYDIAISLFTNFPDFIDIGWAAGIPVRVGFRRSIFASLATHLVDEPESPFAHQGVRLAETLRALPIDPALFHLRRSVIAPDSSSSLQEVSSVLQYQTDQARYRIIHMGTGAKCREMPVTFWRHLAERLCQEHLLIFTGQGEREAATAQAVIAGLPNCINACNRLSWSGFVTAVRHAELLYGVESMAGHVAGAVGTQCIVIYSGTAGAGRWRPEGSRSVVVTNHVSCAPCLQAEGCASMTCLQGITPDDFARFESREPAEQLIR